MDKRVVKLVSFICQPPRATPCWKSGWGFLLLLLFFNGSRQTTYVHCRHLLDLLYKTPVPFKEDESGFVRHITPYYLLSFTIRHLNVEEMLFCFLFISWHFVTRDIYIFLNRLSFLCHTNEVPNGNMSANKLSAKKLGFEVLWCIIELQIIYN